MSRIHLATHCFSEQRDAEQPRGAAPHAGTPSVEGARTAGQVMVRRNAQAGYQRLAQAVRGFWSASSLFDFGLGARVLLVVSSVHGEGASTVARNLAMRLTESSHGRVLLIDGNLRTPSQHQALGVARAEGLTERILDGGHESHAVPIECACGVAFLPCGDLPENPPQLLGMAATGNVLRDLASKFDWVVVDAPPATQYSDAAILARFADAAILVVQAEATRHEVVEQARRTLEDAGVRILGAVLNRRRYHIPERLYRRLA